MLYPMDWVRESGSAAVSVDERAVRGMIRGMPPGRVRVLTFDRDRLRALMEQRGWTIGQAAAALGGAHGALNNYLYAGGLPSPAALVHIAETFGVPTTELAPLSERPTLHELRWHTGLQLGEFADRVGLSSAVISAQMRGASRITRPQIWCELLDITPEQLNVAWETSRQATAEAPHQSNQSDQNNDNNKTNQTSRGDSPG